MLAVAFAGAVAIALWLLVRQPQDRTQGAKQLLVTAKAHLEAGQYLEALPPAGEVIRLLPSGSPDLPDALITLAAAQLHLGKHEEASLSARKAVDLISPASADYERALAMSAQAAWLAGDFEVSLAAFERYMELCEHGTCSNRPHVFYMFGRVLDELGKSQRAAEAYTVVIESVRDRPEKHLQGVRAMALASRALVYAKMTEQNNTEAAFEEAEQAMVHAFGDDHPETSSFRADMARAMAERPPVH